MKSEAIFEWMLIIVIIIIILCLTAIVTTSIIEYLSLDFGHTNLKVLIYGNNIISLLIGFLVFWFFNTFILHCISIIVDVEVNADYVKLLRKIGTGLIIFLFLIFFNIIHVMRYISNVEFTENFSIESLNKFLISSGSRVRSLAATCLYFGWSIICTKKVYKLSNKNTFLLSASFAVLCVLIYLLIKIIS